VADSRWPAAPSSCRLDRPRRTNACSHSPIRHPQYTHRHRAAAYGGHGAVEGNQLFVSLRSADQPWPPRTADIRWADAWGGGCLGPAGSSQPPPTLTLPINHLNPHPPPPGQRPLRPDRRRHTQEGGGRPGRPRRPAAAVLVGGQCSSACFRRGVRARACGWHRSPRPLDCRATLPCDATQAPEGAGPRRRQQDPQPDAHASTFDFEDRRLCVSNRCFRALPSVCPDPSRSLNTSHHSHIPSRTRQAHRHGHQGLRPARRRPQLQPARGGGRRRPAG
jgi:hypothetical protein